MLFYAQINPSHGVTKMDWWLVLQVAIGSFAGIWIFISIGGFFAFLPYFIEDVREDHTIRNVIGAIFGFLFLVILSPFILVYGLFQLIDE